MLLALFPLSYGRTSMELVGRVTRTQTTEDGQLQAEFRCTNKEVFYFFVAPNISLPEDELIRCFTDLLERKDRVREYVLNRWEEL